MLSMSTVYCLQDMMLSDTSNLSRVSSLFTVYHLQDVMLSGTSTQSPVSSVLTVPPVTNQTITCSIGATAINMAAALTSALGDNFLLGIPSLGLPEMSELQRHEQTSSKMVYISIHRVISLYLSIELLLLYIKSVYWYMLCQ